LFNYMRHGHCFPTQKAREYGPVMTDLLCRIREMLDRRGREKGKALTLGVMVPQTLEECHSLGYDVPAWIREGVIDYVCPCDFHYPDFNAPYEVFSALTRGTRCFLYPTLAPMLCRSDEVTLLDADNYRALAQNFYGAGADGITVFNYQYHWARKGGAARYPGPVEGYPLALSYLRELRDPKAMSARTRHYRFHPLWGGMAPTGAEKDDKIVLPRKVGSRGQYRLRLCERLTENMRAVLYFSAQGLLPQDQIGVRFDGSEVGDLRRVFHPEGRRAQFGRPLPPFSSVWFDLRGRPRDGRDHYLEVRLVRPASNAAEDVVIDEIEVVVMPPRRRPTPPAPLPTREGGVW